MLPCDWETLWTQTNFTSRVNPSYAQHGHPAILIMGTGQIIVSLFSRWFQEAQTQIDSPNTLAMLSFMVQSYVPFFFFCFFNFI